MEENEQTMMRFQATNNLVNLIAMLFHRKPTSNNVIFIANY